MSDTNVPVRPEVANILNEAQSNASFEKMMKFDKGRYLCDGQEIPIDTKMIAHCIGWGKEWVKFEGGQFIERKIYRISRGDKVPSREDLDAQNEALWQKGFNNLPKDPWVFRYLLPMQVVETDEPLIFVTPSFGGRRAVDDLCNAYGRRAMRDPKCGQPIIRLQIAMMPTKNFGNVPRPFFTIIGWDDGTAPVREITDVALRQADFDDTIPF